MLEIKLNCDFDQIHKYREWDKASHQHQSERGHSVGAVSHGGGDGLSQRSNQASMASFGRVKSIRPMSGGRSKTNESGKNIGIEYLESNKSGSY